ncbi:alpha/beta hydrolase [Methanofollis ethanolicus]|uniref:alpha/beta hydrolase n=1 Tax=Methanofollis ethanolicus TaxID=488124 RepID=UPI0008341C9A|nr:alpha/beta hydrolase [Methanofollis ethanolicus]
MREGVLGVLLVVVLAAAGCTAAPSYGVDGDGVLSLSVPTPSYDETVQNTTGNVTVSEIVLHRDVEVACLLAAPADPRAGIVYAPGAGVKKEAHRDRAIEYAENGIAFLIVDVRGNGGATPGHPLDFDADFEVFEKGDWPQMYAVAADMIAAREVLVARCPGTPVHAMGASNGGRYAAMAAAADPAFAGYIGVSTSGFCRSGDRYAGDARRFLLSVDPSVSVASISPRPVTVFHAPDDPVIPFADGQALSDAAKEPKEFVPFNGTHGVNAEVDARVIAVCV